MFFGINKAQISDNELIIFATNNMHVTKHIATRCMLLSEHNQILCHKLT